MRKYCFLRMPFVLAVNEVNDSVYICSGPFAGTYEMPTGGIGTWYAPRGHTRIADTDAKLL